MACSSRVVTHKQQHLKINNYGASSANLGVGRDNENVPRNCAVYAKNLCKVYGEHRVLHNFCMSVKKGSIYGLLGASSCGKTTLISCIVGTAKWRSGELLIFGKKPLSTSASGASRNSLGYMPQDLSLYGPLTFTEVTQFYGRLYGMSTAEINERRNFLIKLLKLPEKFKRISELSGGQKRRASLAVAMLHSPELLVLDEPTVGLDPLLRIKIWEHLKDIVNTLEITVLITTHYIEEARNSATVGVMRDGRLVVENTPSNLLEGYNCDLLEHVVLKICKEGASPSAMDAVTSQHDNTRSILFQPAWWNDDRDVKSFKSEYGRFRTPHEFDCTPDFDNNDRGKSKEIRKNVESKSALKRKLNGLYDSTRRLYGFTVVLLRIYLRYPLFLALVFLLPSIQGGIVFLTFSSNLNGINFGVLNHDLVDWDTQCQNSNESIISCDFSKLLSCNYLNQLRKDGFMILKKYNREEDALASVYLGESSGYLIFTTNYSQHVMDLATTKFFATDEAIEGSRIRIRMDHSQYLSSLLITKYLYASYLAFVKNTVTSCNISGEEAVLPLNFRPPIFGEDDDDYTSFAMPGFITCLLFGGVTCLTGVLLISDKRDGTLIRARVAGLAATDVLISHLITQTIVFTIAMVIFGFALLLGTKFTIHGSPLTCLAILIFTIWYSAAFGVLLGIIFDREVYVLLAGVFLGNNFVLLSDGFYPKEGMTNFCKLFGKFLPTALPTEALRSATVRGHGLMQPEIWMGFAAMVPWIFVLSLCCVFACKKYL